MNYDADFFLNFYSPIPEDDWCIGDLTIGHRHCALGFVRAEFKSNYIDNCLANLFASIGVCVTTVNDRRTDKYIQEHPKDRIIAALLDIKANEALQEAQEIVNTETPELVNP